MRRFTRVTESHLLVHMQQTKTTISALEDVMVYFAVYLTYLDV
jgi:hypothetical protein